MNQTIKVPPAATDHASTVAQISPDADAVGVTLSDAAMIQFVAAYEQAGLTAQIISTVGTINDHVIEETGGAETSLNGALLYAPFPSPEYPAWADLTTALENAGSEATVGDQNVQSVWVAMLVLREVLSDAPDVSAAGLTAALGTADAVETGGLTPPLDFTTPFESPYSRMFNRTYYYLTIEDGRFVSADNDEPHDLTEAILG